jgi:preprotein translocase subunit SecD
MSPRPPLAYAAIAALIVGFLLLVLFHAWFTRAFGVLALFAGVLTGVFAIADPAFLEQEDEGTTP